MILSIAKKNTGLDGIVYWKEHRDLCAKPSDLPAALSDKDRVFQKDLMLVNFTLLPINQFRKKFQGRFGINYTMGLFQCSNSYFCFLWPKEVAKK